MPDSSNDASGDSHLRFEGPGSYPMHAPTFDCERALAAALDDEYDVCVGSIDWSYSATENKNNAQSWLQRLLQAALRHGQNGHSRLA